MATILVHGAEGAGTTSVVNMLKEPSQPMSKDEKLWVHKLIDQPLKTATITEDLNAKNVQLCLWVFSKGRYTLDHQEAYERLARYKVPIIMVITRCDIETNRQDFWNQNKSFLAGRCPGVIDGIGICAASAQTISYINAQVRPVYAQSRLESINDLRSKILVNGFEV